MANKVIQALLDALKNLGASRKPTLQPVPVVNDAGLPDLLMSDDAAGSRAVRRVVITGCVVNACLMVMKLLTGWLGHSEALVADGFHSLNDVA